MEYFDVQFNLNTTELDDFLSNGLRLSKELVATSHFYSNLTEQDIEFHDVNSFINLFQTSGTGTISTKEINLGIELSSVTVVLSFGQSNGKIDISFNECELLESGKLNKVKCLSLLGFFQDLMSEYNITNFRFGYEPVHQDDMCLVIIKDAQSDISKLIQQI